MARTAADALVEALLEWQVEVIIGRRLSSHLAKPLFGT